MEETRETATFADAEQALLRAIVDSAEDVAVPPPVDEIGCDPGRQFGESLLVRVNHLLPADMLRHRRGGPWLEGMPMAAAEARVSRVRVRTLDTTPRPRRYRWRMPAWMEAAAVIVGGTALLWGLYVGMWAVVGK